MLRIAEQWHGSDLGLQRQGNEDNYFVRAPLFVVADGMGGAQAGEVASEMAVESFNSGLPDGDPGEGLRELIEEANRRIHARSRESSGKAGMGTTVTAAHVGEDSVTIAHVGDSRCYLGRNDTLTRLTRDHSLVEELVARGKLTPEQAETHPQRSVITRALGPEANVQVDIITEPAQAGDVFLVCSDGLTSMVREPNLKPLLVGNNKPLDELGRSLIAAANEAGGRDNITVILFKLDEVEVPAAPAPPPAAAVEAEEDEPISEYDTFTGEAVATPRQGVSRPQGHTRHTDEDLTAVGAASDTQEREYRASGTVALSAVRPRAQPIEEGAHAPPAPPAPGPPPPPAAPHATRGDGAAGSSPRAAFPHSVASSACCPPSQSPRARCPPPAPTTAPLT